MIETGVYGILNTKTGKIYVGGAYSSFTARYASHVSTLNRGKHHNKHLQMSWNKYGSDVFTFKIIERCGPEKEVIREKETFWISTLDATNPASGYNFSATANAGRGKSVTPTKKCSVSLTDANIEVLRTYGNGSVSTGARLLIECCAALIEQGKIAPTNVWRQHVTQRPPNPHSQSRCQMVRHQWLQGTANDRAV